MKHFIIFLLLIFFLACHSDEIILTDINQHRFLFTSFRGKWVILNYWADWCNPCIKEIQTLNTFSKKYNPKVTIIGVNADGLSLEKLKKLIKEKDIHYLHLDKDPALTLKLGEIVAIPTTYIFNPNGKWVKTLYGEQTEKSLKNAINSHKNK